MIQQQQRHRVRAYHQRQRWLAGAPHRREERKRQRQIWWQQAAEFFDRLAATVPMSTTIIPARLVRLIIEAHEAGKDE